MEEKYRIRAEVSKTLALMSEANYKERSRALCGQVTITEAWKRSETIALTVSRFPEVDTMPLIQKALNENKRVVLPRTKMKDRSMDFHTVVSMDQLEKRSYGLLEPKEQNHTYVAPYEIDIILVPGVAFTKTGARLGLGGGFYDRFLPQAVAQSFSICFREQLYDLIPTEPHDCLIDVVISE